METRKPHTTFVPAEDKCTATLVPHQEKPHNKHRHACPPLDQPNPTNRTPTRGRSNLNTGQIFLARAVLAGQKLLARAKSSCWGSSCSGRTFLVGQKLLAWAKICQGLWFWDDTSPPDRRLPSQPLRGNVGNDRATVGKRTQDLNPGNGDASQPHLSESHAKRLGGIGINIAGFKWFSRSTFARGACLPTNVRSLLDVHQPRVVPADGGWGNGQRGVVPWRQCCRGSFDWPARVWRVLMRVLAQIASGGVASVDIRRCLTSTPDGNGRVWRLAPAPGLVPAPSLLRSFSIRSILSNPFRLSQSILLSQSIAPTKPFCLGQSILLEPRARRSVLGSPPVARAWSNIRTWSNRTGLIKVHHG